MENLVFSLCRFYDHGKFSTNTTKARWLEGKEEAFWLQLYMCFSECGSTITIKAQIMRINVCKKLFIRSVRRRSKMHIFMVLCKSFLIFFRLFFPETIQRHDSNDFFHRRRKVFPGFLFSVGFFRFIKNAQRKKFLAKRSARGR